MPDRIIALIDMDCFYCQVEVRLNPSLKGKPVAVVQYNTWKGGGIIAVNYEARGLGVTRFMRGDDAQKHCPSLELAAVPEVRGRADLSKYRDASREVMAILCEFCPCVEKASIDEAYLDLTESVSMMNDTVEWEKLKNTFVVGYSSDAEGTKQWLKDIFYGGINDTHACNLARAALLVENIRATVQSKTGFHCSAGISHNKILAKLSCGLHKPKRQTVLPQTSVSILFENLPLKKVRNLGGKFGNEVNEQLDVKTIGEVTKFSLSELQRKFGEKHGSWLYNIARGIDTEPVTARTMAKSIGCCKNFKGHLALASKNDVKHWLAELCAEIYERLQDDLITNKRRATLLTVSGHRAKDDNISFSKSTLVNSYNVEEMTKNCYTRLRKFNLASSESPAWEPPLKFLGVSASKFVPVADPSRSLLNFFKPKTEEELDCSASTSSAVSESPRLHQAIVTAANQSPKRVDVANASVAVDDSDSFFCAYFGAAAGGNERDANESTEDSSTTTTEPGVEAESSEPNETAEADMLAVMERCPDCNQLVPIVDVPEHADYHAARKLHEELNGVVTERDGVAPNAAAHIPATGGAPSWTHTSAGRGKHKKLARGRSDPLASRNRPITSFFQAKQRH